MSVDPQVQVLIDALAEVGGARYIEMSASDARAWFSNFRRPFVYGLTVSLDRDEMRWVYTEDRSRVQKIVSWSHFILFRNLHLTALSAPTTQTKK